MRWISCVACLSLLGWPLLLPSSSSAATPTTLYVAVGGSDAGNCEQASAPCATIDYAVSQAPANHQTTSSAPARRRNSF